MMGNNKKMTTGPSVIAITQEGDRLKAVMLRKVGGDFELVWTKSSDLDQTSWRQFATREPIRVTYETLPQTLVVGKCRGLLVSVTRCTPDSTPT